MNRFYGFAGVEIGISMPEERFFENEYRMEAFRLERAEDPHWFHVSFTEELPEPEGQLLACTPTFRVYSQEGSQVRYIGPCQEDWQKANIRVDHRGKAHQILLKNSAYPGRVGTKTLLEGIAAEHLIARNRGVVFHCSFINRGGKAILFTAPSETGKSTQADLWQKYRGTEIVNGDRAAIRLADGVLLAEGIPFAGSSQYCKNQSLPLGAIVYLAQAPHTTIRRMRGYEAFSRIWEGISINTWDKQDLELASDTVKRIAESVPVFHMPCTPDEAAVIALEQALAQQEG